MILFADRLINRLNNTVEKLVKKKHFKIAAFLLHIIYLVEGKRDKNKLLQEAIWELKGKNYKKAIKRLKDCIESEIQLEKSLKLLGMAYRFAGNYKKAIETHRQCLKKALETQYSDILYLLGEDFEKIGDLEKAKSYYKNAIEKDSTKYNAYFKLAHIYIEKEHYRKAIKLLLEGLKIREQLEEWIKLVICYIKIKRYQAAKKVLENVRERYGDNELIKYTLGLYSINIGNFKKAEEVYEELKQNRELAQAIKVKILLEKKNYKELLKLLQKTTKTKRDGEYWYLRALVETKLGLEKEAKKSIKRAIKKQPDLRKRGLQEAKFVEIMRK